MAKSGGEDPGGDDAHLGACGVLDGVSRTSSTASLTCQTDKHAVTGLVSVLQGGTSDEVALLLEAHDPAEPCLGGEGLRGELMAVQWHPGLQAQGVAAGQTTRHDILAASVLQAGPQGFGLCIWHVELESVLPGVAGAGHHDRGTLPRAGEHPVVPEVTDLVRGEAGVCPAQRPEQDLGRCRPLQGDEGGAGRLVGDGDVESAAAFGDGSQIGGDIGGIGDDDVLVVGNVIGDEVVCDGAPFGEEQGVLGAPHAHAGELAGQGVVQGLTSLRTGNPNLSHVRQVEESRAGAHCSVLGEV